MRNKLRDIFLGSVLTIGSILPSFGQQDTILQDDPKPKTHLIHKGMVWNLKSMDVSQNDLTSVFVNVVKHKKLKGFGIMTNVVTKPFNIGVDGKFVVPLAAPLIHYGNKKANVNVGPVFKNNGVSGVNGYRVIGNLSEGRVSVRSVVDMNTDLTLGNLGLHGVYQLNKHIDATLGVNSAPQGTTSIQVGMALKY